MNKKTLYLECYSGISGDMTVAALLDLGASQDVLMAGLNSLHVEGYKIKIGRRIKSSIDACDFDVILDQNGHSHMDDEHSHDHNHNGEHDHGHEYTHIQNHDHDHNHTPIQLGQHDHRNLYDINTIIDNSDISKKAKEIAKKTFHIVAVAEAKAHGKSIEEVHFHEVGAIDSIVDIVAAAICLDNLGIEEVIVSELYEGTGHIKCQHGILPVPVPAVANIAAEHHIPLHITSVKGELVTPTGAAIVAAIRTKDSLPKDFRIHRIGLGAGKREYEQASILRAMLIEDITVNSGNTINDKVWVLEANIDDCSGEALSFTMDLLLEKGAKDVYYTPIYMKKNRPAYMLGVICDEEKLSLLEEIIFTHTTTIGIRKHEDTRTTLGREVRKVATPYGDALVKVCTYNQNTFYYPEYESVKKICLEYNKDYNSIYQLIQKIALEL
ncbi:hypothetical protein EDD66_11165 [Mobilisporobacter senegalensis]|uniref:Pyridinium-3,5-bisthiocarboxylic acid mononucleotide nickel insertion protein n=1 Tax=Mobilisporobacter senegalensis TaxID=1329262 RepID=A0A3N1XF02_9FIRM|nr:nickel pincer cofactor biosynthesis protein LarC [Mobilisporobacter senegalensis]ROR25303.1 hypothetical protein EDD66_11165 [Mobilisporobacter senegalensis]